MSVGSKPKPPWRSSSDWPLSSASAPRSIDTHAAPSDRNPPSAPASRYTTPESPSNSTVMAPSPSGSGMSPRANSEERSVFTDTSCDSLSTAPETEISARSSADTVRSNSTVRAETAPWAAAINEYGSATSPPSPDPFPVNATKAPTPSAITATTAAASANGRRRPRPSEIGAAAGTGSISGNCTSGNRAEDAPVTGGPVGGANVEVMETGYDVAVIDVRHSRVKTSSHRSGTGTVAT